MLRRKPPLIATSPETTEKNQNRNGNTEYYRRDEIQGDLATQSARVCRSFLPRSLTCLGLCYQALPFATKLIEVRLQGGGVLP
jgi:hypothetical protein